MSARLFFRLLLIAAVLSGISMACLSGGGDGSSGGGAETQSAEAIAAGATATFGAEQFHAQLTAIAQPQVQP